MKMKKPIRYNVTFDIGEFDEGKDELLYADDLLVIGVRRDDNEVLVYRGISGHTKEPLTSNEIFRILLYMAADIANDEDASKWKRELCKIFVKSSFETVGQQYTAGGQQSIADESQKAHQVGLGNPVGKPDKQDHVIRSRPFEPVSHLIRSQIAAHEFQVNAELLSRPRQFRLNAAMRIEI